MESELSGWRGRERQYNCVHTYSHTMSYKHYVVNSIVGREREEETEQERKGRTETKQFEQHRNCSGYDAQGCTIIQCLHMPSCTSLPLTVYVRIYVGFAQSNSMDLCNPRIALRKAWIQALRDDPWIVRSIRGLHNSQCAKCRFASDQPAPTVVLHSYTWRWYNQTPPQQSDAMKHIIPLRQVSLMSGYTFGGV